MSLASDLRYSVRSFARTPGAAAALVLSIALGVGSNAAVHGFVRGLIAHDSPLTANERLASVFAREGDRATGMMSYEDFVSLTARGRGVFEWVGALRDSQRMVLVGDRSRIVPVAAATADIAHLLDLPLEGGAVISHRFAVAEFGEATRARGQRLVIDGSTMRIAGVAPETLEGLYAERPVDVWIPLREEALRGIDRSSRTFWVLARLRAGITAEGARSLLNRDRGAAIEVGVFRFSGTTPDMANGFSRVGMLLEITAAAVFFIACANVTAFLLGRASARSTETAVRVAIGASRGQLVRQLLSDSVLISIIGGAFGVLLAVWTLHVVPAFLFEEDAEHLAFVPNLLSIVLAAIVCAAMTIVCGLMPLFELGHDRPAAVLQRESAGPSTAIRRLRAGLVVAQMASCCVLLISTGLLVDALHAVLRTSIGHRLGKPILVTVQAQPASGSQYFGDLERTAQDIGGVSEVAWAGTLPGGRPTWLSLRIEPRNRAMRDAVMDVVPFTPATLGSITLPAIAGRMFGGADTPESCRVAVVNDEAANTVFGGRAVGQSVIDPAGLRVEIVGVVASRKPEHDSSPSRPIIYYYEQQTGPPRGAVGSAHFHVPETIDLSEAVLDADVVSSSYFGSMGLPVIAGQIFQDTTARGSCRVGVINQEAADLYFGGHAVGAAVIDHSGTRTAIVGVVHSAPVGTFLRHPEPAIYFPMSQDFRPGMTLILGTQAPTPRMLAEIERRLNAVMGGQGPVTVRTLEAHLARTALAPLRIATVLVGASAAMALVLGIIGLYATLNDSARQRRREIAIRAALGAQSWRLIRQVVAEGARLTGAGTVAGLLVSIVVARALTRLAPDGGARTRWIWIAVPAVLTAAVAIASALPARRAIRVDPLSITRDS